MRHLVAALSLFMFVMPACAVDEDSITYAVAGAAIAASISYCHAKYGRVARSKRGGQCFDAGRALIPNLGDTAAAIHQLCPDKASYATCLTPQLGNFVNELVRKFDAARM